MRRLALLPLAASLIGCPLALNNDDDDATSDDDDVSGDDDDATGDDDDATGDDDDATGDDDDDDDDDTPSSGCAELGTGSVWFGVSGEAIAGSWIEGELAATEDLVSVTPEFGPAFAASFFMTDDFEPPNLLEELAGPGRLWFSSDGLTWKGSDAVLAAETDAGVEVAIGNRNGPPIELEELGFTLRMKLDAAACPTGLTDVDGCGLAAALPAQVTFSDGAVDATGVVFPGESLSIGDWVFRLHRSWHMPLVECDDFPSSDWTWSVSRL